MFTVILIGKRYQRGVLVLNQGVLWPPATDHSPLHHLPPDHQSLPSSGHPIYQDGFGWLSIQRIIFEGLRTKNPQGIYTFPSLLINILKAERKKVSNSPRAQRLNDKINFSNTMHFKISVLYLCLVHLLFSLSFSISSKLSKKLPK